MDQPSNNTSVTHPKTESANVVAANNAPVGASDSTHAGDGANVDHPTTGALGVVNAINTPTAQGAGTSTTPLVTASTVMSHPPISATPPVLMTAHAAPVAAGVPPGSSTPDSKNQQLRHLNVYDALSYLDQVKTQFASQPDVYTQFLDIMKEFKTHALDTPGVIERVSNLFRGYPSLIIGFNTFLPKGFKIEVPEGMMDLESNPHKIYEQPKQQPHPGSVGMSKMMNPNPAMHHVTAPPKQMAPLTTPAPSVVSTPSQYPLPPPSNVPASSVRGPYAGPHNALPSRLGPVEFNHAVSYVNKIKNRFVNEPETYKKFLEILYTYQKETRTIREVFTEVRQLFAPHPDLLDEFAQFLPEQHGFNIRTSPAPMPSVIQQQQQPQQQAAPPMSYAANPDMVHATRRTNAAVKPQRKRMAPQAPPSSPPPQAPPKRARTHPKIEQVMQSRSEFEEFEFFDKVKKFLNNRSVYGEFLKCINLYTQEAIQINELVRLVTGFLAKAPELLDWFKSFVGFKDPHTDKLQPLPRDGASASTSSNSIDLSKCKKIGSFRLFPRSYSRPSCNGRDELGLEVLNSTLVSCPQFNSESQEFLASKKNQHEEILFKCEDERFEMDLLIEANLSTIQVLEPLAKRLEMMSQEEAEKLRLGQNLGGTSEVVYYKAIKRIYGDKASEVYESLKNSPCVAVPVVLNRLKQKDQEWRRCQREWNKIWREVHSKNHYKSLDHQGVNFRTNDRKAMTPRSLIGEAEALLQENRKNNITNVNHHEYSFSEQSVFKDAIELLAFFVCNTASITLADKKEMRIFLSRFIKTFFNADLPEIKTFDEEDEEEEPITLPVMDSEKTVYVFYGNSTFYVFFRLLQLMYARLLAMKELADSFIDNPPPHHYVSQVALHLDVPKPPLLDIPVTEYYVTLLRLLKDVLCNQLDMNSFEDQVRFMFGTGSFVLFTMDKLIQSVARQMSAIVNDSKSEQLISLYEQERDIEKTSFRSEYSLRSAADSVVGEDKEQLFRIEFDSVAFRMAIQLVDKTVVSQDVHSVEEKWSLYVDDFVKVEGSFDNVSSEGLLFMKRNLNPNITQPSILCYNLECKICVNTYKMFFVENSEDVLYRVDRGEYRARKTLNELFGHGMEE